MFLTTFFIFNFGRGAGCELYSTLTGRCPTITICGFLSALCQLWGDDVIGYLDLILGAGVSYALQVWDRALTRL